MLRIQSLPHKAETNAPQSHKISGQDKFTESIYVLEFDVIETKIIKIQSFFFFFFGFSFSGHLFFPRKIISRNMILCLERGNNYLQNARTLIQTLPKFLVIFMENQEICWFVE